jgi:hypothetical protein
MISILILAISTNHLLAQNTTTNLSKAAGNMIAAANQATSDLGQNASSELNNAGDKVGSALGELKQNKSTVGREIK